MENGEILNFRHGGNAEDAENDDIVNRTHADEESNDPDVFHHKLREVTSIVRTLREIHPDFDVDANEVYELIEAESATPNRRNVVIDRLITKRLTKIQEKNENEKFNELVKDVDVVSRCVPNKSREEIFAYLEAFHGNPNRVRVVIAELLDMNNEEQEATAELLDMNNYEQEATAPTSAEENDDQSTATAKVDSILELFPDADPEYLRTFIGKYTNDADYINATVAEWLENRSLYPKMADAQRAATKRKFVESDFSVEEFLEMFPDPENYFQNHTRVVSQSYKQHVECYVQNKFRYAYKADLVYVMEKHLFHLTPIMKELNSQWNVGSDEPLVKKTKETVRIKTKISAIKPMPNTIDELFYKEMLFIEMEDRIKQFKKDKEMEQRRKIEMVKENGQLMTCGCCFDDELLIEDMLQCSDGHLFCKICIRRYAEVQIGQGKYEFHCLDPQCESEFSPITLQNVLPPNVFSSLVRRMQEEEIRRADIPDLVSCPHCSFCAIVSDPNLKIFRCFNPECLKVTCRLCRKAYHLPLPCDEAEEQRSEVQFRTYIENRMTDALLRTCPWCKRRFIKEYGCNKMKCICGQFFCYVCREPIVGNFHFKDGECPLFTNDEEFHRLEVQECAKKAKKEYIETHPEVRTVELKHDPTQTPFAAVPEKIEPYAL